MVASCTGTARSILQGSAVHRQGDPLGGSLVSAVLDQLPRSGADASRPRRRGRAHHRLLLGPRGCARTWSGPTPPLAPSFRRPASRARRQRLAPAIIAASRGFLWAVTANHPAATPVMACAISTQSGCPGAASYPTSSIAAISTSEMAMTRSGISERRRFAHRPRPLATWIRRCFVEESAPSEDFPEPDCASPECGGRMMEHRMKVQHGSEFVSGPAAIAAVLVLLTALSACGPMPWGPTDRGATAVGDGTGHNVGYELSDHAFPGGSEANGG
jgi:hypothetical protein